MALEAKVITPWGWAITVAVEPMRLKRIFGRHGVILMGDALYACKAGLETVYLNHTYEDVCLLTS